jgi:hypothetical protein
MADPAARGQTQKLTAGKFHSALPRWLGGRLLRPSMAVALTKIRFWLDALVLVGGQRFKCRKLLIEI